MYPSVFYFFRNQYYFARVVINFPSVSNLPITYITVPKPSDSSFQDFKYRLIFSTWLQSSSKAEILLFVDQKEFDPRQTIIPFLTTNFGEKRIIFGGNLPTGFRNKPLIGEWIRQGILLSNTNYVTFINSDIMIVPTWTAKIHRVFLTFSNESVFIMGIRNNFIFNSDKFHQMDLTSPTLLIDIQNEAKKHEIPHGTSGCDTFTFQKNPPPFDFETFPNFTLGFCIWDNYFMGEGIKHSTSVTFYDEPGVLHIEHPTNLTCGWNEPHNIPNREIFLTNQGFSGTSKEAKYIAKDDHLMNQKTKEIIPMFPYF